MRVMESDKIKTIILNMDTMIRKGHVTKKISIVEGQNILYITHILEGFEGKMPIGHHATLAIPDSEGALKVSVGEPHFCNVRRPNEKGVVEGSVKYSRLNFMVPVPLVKDYEELNRLLRDCCKSDLDRILWGKGSLSKKQLLAEDRIAAIALPDDKFDYRKTTSTFAGSESLVRYDTNDYSVPVSSAHHQTTIKASVRFIEVYRQDLLIAQHRRCWDRECQIFNPMHYLELLERKPGALDHARPLEDWHLPKCFNTYRKLLETHRDNGTKEYIQILLLLKKYSITQIAKAIGKALNYRMYCYDAIQQFLLTAEDYALTTFSLAGREHLRRIVVNETEPAAYSSLVSGGHHAKRA